MANTYLWAGGVPNAATVKRALNLTQQQIEKEIWWASSNQLGFTNLSNARFAETRANRDHRSPLLVFVDMSAGCSRAGSLFLKRCMRDAGLTVIIYNVPNTFPRGMHPDELIKGGVIEVDGSVRELHNGELHSMHSRNLRFLATRLGLSTHEPIDADTVRRAYYRAAKLLHPDKRKIVGCEKDFIELREIYDELLERLQQGGA